MKHGDILVDSTTKVCDLADRNILFPFNIDRHARNCKKYMVIRADSYQKPKSRIFKFIHIMSLISSDVQKLITNILTHAVDLSVTHELDSMLRATDFIQSEITR